MKKFFLNVLFYVLSWPLLAAEDFYQFHSEQQQERFIELTSKLRCLVCQNQNIAESNAPLANDLRETVYQQIQQGQTDQQIIDYLVARYGDFILYQPPFTWATLGLWCGPLLFLLIGIGYLVYWINSRKKS